MQHYSMTIDGHPVDSEQILEVINPATAQPFATCALANSEDLDNAIHAAKVAFEQWKNVPETQRQALLHQLASVLESNKDELIQLVVKETGKPIVGLSGVGATMEVMGAVAWTHVTADIEIANEVVQDDDEAFVSITRKPLGVVASITPWNWPLLIAIWHVIAAIKAGNTVVIKPSELTPISTLRFVELANTVLPKGVLNVVTGDASIGQQLTNSTQVSKIVFTGSTATGKKIMETASKTLKRLVLELGGNDAAIVLPDADLNALAQDIFAAAFHNNGQTCACIKRLYVPSTLHDELCQRFTALAKDIRMGDGINSDVELGPIQNSTQFRLVEGLIERAINDGGKVLCGGQADNSSGYFIPPTLISGLSNGHELVDTEQFGPVLPIIKYDTIDEAVALANDSPNGLGGSVWGTDLDQAEQIGRRLECGTLWINGHGGVQPNAPFGGVKESGVGVEFGRQGLEEYTSIQTVKIHR